MKRLIILITITIFIFGSCTVARRNFKSELDFANKLAQQGLWQEAYYRWQKALSQGKESAEIHNNMAIALESMGRFAEAEKEYQEALKLAPGHPHIKKNHKSLQKLLGKIKEEKDEQGGKK